MYEFVALFSPWASSNGPFGAGADGGVVVVVVVQPVMAAGQIETAGQLGVDSGGV